MTIDRKWAIVLKAMKIALIFFSSMVFPFLVTEKRGITNIKQLYFDIAKEWEV